MEVVLGHRILAKGLLVRVMIAQWSFTPALMTLRWQDSATTRRWC